MSKISEDQQIKIFKSIMEKDSSNLICADCDMKNPTWCSLDLGVFVCLDCSGGHRKLGPTISRIRSYKIDSWMEKDIKIFQHVGNREANQYYEAKLKKGPTKPCQDSPLDEKIAYVRNKYYDKRFVANSNQPSPAQIFFQSGKGFENPNNKNNGNPNQQNGSDKRASSYHPENQFDFFGQFNKNSPTKLQQNQESNQRQQNQQIPTSKNNQKHAQLPPVYRQSADIVNQKQKQVQMIWDMSQFMSKDSPSSQKDFSSKNELDVPQNQNSQNQLENKSSQFNSFNHVSKQPDPFDENFMNGFKSADNSFPSQPFQDKRTQKNVSGKEQKDNSKQQDTQKQNRNQGQQQSRQQDDPSSQFNFWNCQNLNNDNQQQSVFFSPQNNNKENNSNAQLQVPQSNFRKHSLQTQVSNDKSKRNQNDDYWQKQFADFSSFNSNQGTNQQNHNQQHHNHNQQHHNHNQQNHNQQNDHHHQQHHNQNSQQHHHQQNSNHQHNNHHHNNHNQKHHSHNSQSSNKNNDFQQFSSPQSHHQPEQISPVSNLASYNDTPLNQQQNANNPFDDFFADFNQQQNIQNNNNQNINNNNQNNGFNGNNQMNQNVRQVNSPNGNFNQMANNQYTTQDLQQFYPTNMNYTNQFHQTNGFQGNGMNNQQQFYNMQQQQNNFQNQNQYNNFNSPQNQFQQQAYMQQNYQQQQQQQQFQNNFHQQNIQQQQQFNPQQQNQMHQGQNVDLLDL